MIKCALCDYTDNDDNFQKFALHLRYNHKITKIQFIKSFVYDIKVKDGYLLSNCGIFI